MANFRREKIIKISLIKLSQELDGGDIIKQMNMILDGTELYEEIRFKQANITFKIIENFLKQYPNFKSKPQSGKSTFYRKRKITDSELNINEKLKDLFPLLRIGNNENGLLFLNLKGIRISLKFIKKMIEINKNKISFELVSGGENN